MKQTLLLLAFCLTIFSVRSFSQTSSVDPCDKMQGKGIISGNSMVLFNLSGINLSNYNWDVPEVNCHINSAIAYNQKKTIEWYGGYAACIIGVGAFVADGIAADRDAKPLLILGVGGVVGGVVLFAQSIKHKKLRDYHMNEVSDYYRENKLNGN